MPAKEAEAQDDALSAKDGAYGPGESGGYPPTADKEEHAEEGGEGEEGFVVGDCVESWWRWGENEEEGGEEGESGVEGEVEGEPGGKRRERGYFRLVYEWTSETYW